MSKSNTIAIVGAGPAGKSLLSILLQIPGIEVKYVCDINPDAPGIALAKHNRIEVLHDSEAKIILEDPCIDMIFEVTGDDLVFEHLQNNKLPSCNIMCASMGKIIFYLLNSQQEVTRDLRKYKLELAERVIERTDELEKVNIQLKEQIEIQQELNSKLQMINNEKTKYLLNSTHQLKAPFAAIQSYVDILLEGYVGNLSDKVLNILYKIKSRCTLLTSSIRRMLELANLNSVIEENIIMTSTSLTDIVNRVIASENPVLENRHISINFSGQENRNIIFCNADQIETLVSNLLDNAINYSEDNSEIDISIDIDTKKRIILSITDYGIGIDEKNLKLIFNEYFRSYNAADKFENGSGLGLPIAKRIARLHHTDIFVDSTIRKGSTFMIPFEKI